MATPRTKPEAHPGGGAHADGVTADVARRAPFSDNPLVGTRGQRTQQRILDAALRVFGEHGYHRASIDRIARLGGCSRVSFYQYFASKEDVFQHLAAQVARQIAALTETLDPITPDDAGRATLLTWVSRYDEIHARYEPVFSAYETDDQLSSIARRTGAHTVTQVTSRLEASTVPSRQLDRVVRLLLQALKNEKDPTIRATIVEGLGKLRASPAFEALAALADSRSESDELRATACLALARLGHAEAVPILTGIASKGSRGLGILKTSSPALRSAAVRALGLFPTNAAAREALKKLVDDSDPALQATARETLFRPVQKALAAPDREPAPAGNAVVQEVRPANVKLSGSLQEIPLDQVCQLVGGSEKTGLLMLSLEGRVGCIWFEQGQVVAADFERTKDQEAINGMARHKKGDFIFQPGERPPARRVQIPVPQALLEAFRVTDEGRK